MDYYRRMRTLVPTFGVLFVLVCGTLAVQTGQRSSLDIYVIDVEGGEATLFVSPAGESLLVDAG